MRAVAVVGPTATGKSGLALAIAERFGGAIVACDSTAVYRGIDIGTDKVPQSEQRGIPHSPRSTSPTPPPSTYSAARYGTDAAEVARAGRRARDGCRYIGWRNRVLITARSTRGLFPGPARDERLARAARAPSPIRRGVEVRSTAGSSRVDPAAGLRIQPRDPQADSMRALEVYLLTGRPLTSHFDATASPIAGFQLLTIGLQMPREELRPRVSRRVDQQFDRGVVDEVKRLLAAGIPVPRTPSAASSIDRLSRCSKVLATSRRRANSSFART